ncbi:hypothetical protein MAL08_19460 (plasmid) [Leptospira noguchii]|uniref:hypothetical protein n=1 Tax=Leptospira noguchii TaxID=28182 RepID=UPI001FB6BDD6|nr:hypothetical protein [Leptospira noguchii]UOG39995.1 hypothetical protein MAL08_19460 [Leptospira noguchii]
MILSLSECRKVKDVKAIVLPVSGVILHETPNSQGKSILRIPHMSSVILIKSDKSEVFNNDGRIVLSKWVFIEYEKYKGWVYGGYLELPEMVKEKNQNQEYLTGTWTITDVVEWQDEDQIQIIANKLHNGKYDIILNPNMSIKYDFRNSRLTCDDSICSLIKGDKKYLKFEIINKNELKVLTSPSGDVDGVPSGKIEFYKILKESGLYFKETNCCAQHIP